MASDSSESVGSNDSNDSNDSNNPSKGDASVFDSDISGTVQADPVTRQLKQK